MTQKIINKYRLDRYIPSNIRRQIRQNSGFGCVICGCAICEYEHVNPPFSSAREHDPDKMTFLCSNCHDKVTRKIWSKDKVVKAMKNPYSLINKQSRFKLDLTGSNSWINFGGIRF
jgi:hypothetical protein